MQRTKHSIVLHDHWETKACRVWWVSKAEAASEHDRSQGAYRCHYWSPAATAAAQRENLMESQRSQGRNAANGENRGRGAVSAPTLVAGATAVLPLQCPNRIPIGGTLMGLSQRLVIKQMQMRPSHRRSTRLTVPWRQSCNTRGLHKKGHYHLL